MKDWFSSLNWGQWMCLGFFVLVGSWVTFVFATGQAAGVNWLSVIISCVAVAVSWLTFSR